MGHNLWLTDQQEWSLKGLFRETVFQTIPWNEKLEFFELYSKKGLIRASGEYAKSI
jgi:hypothetical protein